MNDLTMIEPACFRKYECEDGEIVDVEYNGIDQFSGGRRDGDPLYTDRPKWKPTQPRRCARHWKRRRKHAPTR